MESGYWKVMGRKSLVMTVIFGSRSLLGVVMELRIGESLITIDRTFY